MMGSRDRDQPASHHQPLLSSLVVRPSDSDGEGKAGGGGARTGGSEYEPGEVSHEPPPYSRSHRYSDEPDFIYPGHRTRLGSSSPPRRRDTDHRYASDLDHSGGPPRDRDYTSARDAGSYRDFSPSRTRGGGGGRLFGRGIDGPGFVPGPLRGEGMTRNNPNVRPREGDWICSDPACENLNFARREFCNNCKKPRYGAVGSPRRSFHGPAPHVPGRRFSGPPLDLSPGRATNGYRSPPPRGWARDGPRGFGPGGPLPVRHGGRFSDHDFHRDRPDYLVDGYRGRRYDRPMPTDWGHRDRGRDDFFAERKGFDRRLPSPPPPPMLPPPHRARWGRDVRERSRSPIRAGAPPPREYRRDMYMERGRDDPRGLGRDRVRDLY